MIVVFGSINLDLVARVATLPTPGATLHARGFATSPGGKGANQALAARRAGAEVALFGSTGRDDFAAAALTLIRASGIDVGGVHQHDASTGVALIHVDDAGENAITIVTGANAHATSASIPDAVLGASTTVLLQFETPASESLAVAKRAKARGARVVLNCAPARSLDPEWLSVIDVLIANAGEAAVIARPFTMSTDPAAFAETIASNYDIAAIVTLGAQGVVAATATARYALPALSVNAIDTVGAGDAFSGVLAAALDRGDPLPVALVSATAAGALACTREGAQPALPFAADIANAARRLEDRLRVTPRR